MKYSIHINQREAMQLFPDLDLIDLAIFDFIKDFIAVPECVRLQDGNKTYFMVSWRLIVAQLPIIKIGTQRGIQNRINNLITCGLIEAHPNNEKLGKPFFTVGHNFSKLIFQPTNENSNPRTAVPKPPNVDAGEPRTTVRPPSNESSAYKNISYNNTIEKNISKKIRAQDAHDYDLTDLPLPFDDPDFVNAWESWKLHRQQKKMKLSKLAAGAQLLKLSKECTTGKDAAEWIIHSIASNYQGIFSPKPFRSNGTTEKQQRTRDGFAERQKKYSELD